MTTSAISNSIEAHRKDFGDALTIVAHHYMSEDVIRHADIRGDSLELAQKTARIDSDYIVFCGVYFMAESAALLAREGQQVHIPDPTAECSMALMAPAPLTAAVMEKLTRNGRKVIPVAYVNSTLAIKALVGKYGGTVCTSSNAKAVMEWALGQGDAVIFLPDENLANNVANTIGLPPSERHLINTANHAEDMDLAAADKARLLLWPGDCCIHTHFSIAMVESMRKTHPGAKIVVHPETPQEVVAKADYSGSTSYIIKCAEEAPDGSTLIIGTEINLVKRLAEQHKDRITILPLAKSPCAQMRQVTEERLAACLDALAVSRNTGTPSPFQVHVDESLKAPAKKALERMLNIR